MRKIGREWDKKKKGKLLYEYVHVEVSCHPHRVYGLDVIHVEVHRRRYIIFYHKYSYY